MVAATQVGLQTASKFYILLFKCIMVGLSTRNIFYGLRSISQAKSKAEFENRRIILNFYTPVHSPSLSLLEFSLRHQSATCTEHLSIAPVDLFLVWQSRHQVPHIFGCVNIALDSSISDVLPQRGSQQ